MQTTTAAIAAGAIGTSAITLWHESVRKITPNSPRVELMGMRAIQKFALDPIGTSISRRNLYFLSIAFDLIHNSLGYAMAVGFADPKNKKKIFALGTVYGLATGIFTLLTPPLVGLGQQPTTNMKKTSAMTIGMYIFGGLITAAAFLALSDLSQAAIEEEMYAAV